MEYVDMVGRRLDERDENRKRLEKALMAASPDDIVRVAQGIVESAKCTDSNYGPHMIRAVESYAADAVRYQSESYRMQAVSATLDLARAAEEASRLDQDTEWSSHTNPWVEQQWLTRTTGLVESWNQSRENLAIARRVVGEGAVRLEVPRGVARGVAAEYRNAGYLVEFLDSAAGNMTVIARKAHEVPEV